MTDLTKRIKNGNGAGVMRPGVIGSAAAPGTRKEYREPEYYDVPMLKASEWKWMIPAYFALGGLSGGAYVLARLSERFGGGDLRPLTRVGTFAAAASLAPCPVLLILDLGDPMRFHHMLRVFKPLSPMNLGSWNLTVFGGCVAVATLRELFGIRGPVSRIMMAASDLAGISTGLMMTAYTGILISTTSTPIWTQNPWLGPLFCAGGFEMAAGAISLGLELAGESKVARALKPVTFASRAVAATSLAGYLWSAGDLAKPLTRGKYALHIWGGTVAGGMIATTILELTAGRKSKKAKIAAALLGITGGFLMKWAIGSAGHPSGNDPDAARRSTRGR